MTRDYEATGLTFVEDKPRNWAQGGECVQQMADYIDARLMLHTYSTANVRNIFLLDIGANCGAQANYPTNLQYTVEAIKAKYANAEIFISFPWVRGMEASNAQLHTYIDNVIALHPDYCFPGDDECIWMEGGDNGATMSTDGVHYSDAGYVAKRAAVRAIIGY